MWTISYKGYYINGYSSKPECWIPGVGLCKSFRAAQLAITKHIKANKTT